MGFRQIQSNPWTTLRSLLQVVATDNHGPRDRKNRN